MLDCTKTSKKNSGYNSRDYSVYPFPREHTKRCSKESHKTRQINAHTSKSWLSPAPDRTSLNILDMMNSPEKGDSSGQCPPELSYA